MAANRDLIKRVGSGMQVTLRQVQIHHGVFQVCVSHEKLDRPQVGPGLHQGCRETVTHRVRAECFLDSCAFRGFAADFATLNWPTSIL